MGMEHRRADSIKHRREVNKIAGREGNREKLRRRSGGIWRDPAGLVTVVVHGGMREASAHFLVPNFLGFYAIASSLEDFYQ